MLHVALVCAGLLAAQAGDSSPTPRDLRTYEALKLKAGQDPPALVKLALWCEARGMDAERLKHLAQAVAADPSNATARGLMGLIRFDGRWKSPDQIGGRVQADSQRAARMAEYKERRDRLFEKDRELRAAVERLQEKASPHKSYAARVKMNHDLALAHANLGAWCEENGLKGEAIAHFTTAVHLDPSREASWRHLGYVKHNGRWTGAEEAAAEEKQEHAQRLAARHWEPLLRKWKGWLGGSSSYREQAEEHLATVTDPHAIPLILKFFPIGGSEADQSRLVRLLAQIDDPQSSRALAELAVKTRSARVRTAAIEVLSRRPRRDYAGALVDRIRDKIKYSIQPVEGPGSKGSLVLETPTVRMVMTYNAPAAFQIGKSFYGYIGYDNNGLPVVAQGREVKTMSRDQNPVRVEMKVRQIEERTALMFAEADIRAVAVQQRMAADVDQVETMNSQAEAENAQVIPVLQAAAEAPADLKEDEEAWQSWWYDKLGYSYQSPTQVTIVQNATPVLPAPRITTCFAAGTPVHTLDGPRPVEAIQVGDQVLAQDASTGALAFQPVVFLHHNPPGKTLRVSLSGGDSVVCSVYHRFWRANQGWAMARELKPGDVLRTLGGLARVAKVEPDASEPLYNLDVAGSRTFFAGAGRLLVHDNTLPDHRLKPFDALPDLETAPRRAESGLARD